MRVTTIYEGWQATAERLGVSVSTAKAYEGKGLPVTQPGGKRGKVYITERKVVEWLEFAGWPGTPAGRVGPNFWGLAAGTVC